MRNVSITLVAAAALFIVLEVIYGYVFGVWAELASTSAGTTHFAPTKTGETMLFGFLALALPLLAVPLALSDDTARAGTSHAPPRAR